MSNEIFLSSEKIVKNYLDLIKKFPSEVDTTWEETVGVFNHSLGDGIELNDQQRKSKEREDEVLKRQNDFFEGYSRDDVVLLFNSYEYGKELYTSGEYHLAQLFENAGGREPYFYLVFEDIQRNTAPLSKDELIFLVTGKQDWIVKESLEHYLKEFA